MSKVRSSNKKVTLSELKKQYTTGSQGFKDVKL
jgi:hypothetical protein